MQLPYSFEGKVIHGYQRGSKQLGFATANLDIKSWQPIVTDDFYGVYAGYCRIENEPPRRCILSIGKNTTFNEISPTFEVHILDFDRDIYGSNIRVEVTNKIRQMIKFSSINELKTQISRDKEVAYQLVKNIQ